MTARRSTPPHSTAFLPIPRLVVKPSSTMSRKKCPPSPPWNLHQEIHQPLPDLTGSKRGRRSTRSGHQEKLQHSSVLAKELLDLAIMMRNGKERMTVVPQLFFQHLLSFFQNSDVYIFDGTSPLFCTHCPTQESRWKPKIVINNGGPWKNSSITARRKP